MHYTALVGCAHIHTPGFLKRLKERDDVTVKFVWDHDAGRAKKNADELGTSITDNLDSIWNDSEITSVVICSETDRHEALIEAAAKAGKHIFAEKPLGFGAEDSYRMAKIIEDAGVQFQTGYFMRGNPINIFLREQIQKGSFGKITRIRFSNCHSGALGDWFATDWRWMADVKQAGVGAFGDLGTHVLDIAIWMLGEVESVTAQIDTAIERYAGCDEFGEGIMRFKNGVVGTLAAGWVDVSDPVKLEIAGTEGHAHVVSGKLYFKSEHVDGADGESAWTDLPAERPHAFSQFFDAMTNKGAPQLVTPQEAAYCCAVMEAFYAGDKSKAWVSPKN